MPQHKRFIVWRRTPEEVKDSLNTLQGSVDYARRIIDDGEYDEVIILEVRKVIKAQPRPVTMRNF